MKEIYRVIKHPTEKGAKLLVSKAPDSPHAVHGRVLKSCPFEPSDYRKLMEIKKGLPANQDLRIVGRNVHFYVSLSSKDKKLIRAKLGVRLVCVPGGALNQQYRARIDSF
ncbi:MAG: hypothetical protein V1811_01675 [Candidatus Micrarchaeota archaeon]